MENFYLSGKCVIVCLLVSGLAVTSCSNDDPSDSSKNTDPVIQVGNPLKVFVNKVPQSTSDVKSITLDDKQRVASMETDDGKVTFTYAQTRAESVSYDVVMTIVDEDNSDTSKDVFYLKLGSNGFVESAIEKDEGDDGSSQNWTFAYTSDGQLKFMEKSDEDRYDITYNGDGDITKVNFTDLSGNGDPGEVDLIDYTSEDVPAAIENKGCIMEWDNTLDIDMDNMKYAYYAGLLGKATKHLPLASHAETDGYVQKMNWTLDNSGYPVKLEVIGPYSRTDTYTFTW